MDTYRTEEEQVEAIRRWWDENGRSILVAIVLALAAGFGWQAWKDHNKTQAENASHVYQAMLQSLSDSAPGERDFLEAIDLAEQLKSDYTGTSYAQFASLHLAKLAAKNNDLDEAKHQLLWVLSKAAANSDIAEVAQLRLARVLAAAGETEQALDILATRKSGAYAASSAVVQGDIYMQLGQLDDARDAYLAAKLALANSAAVGRIPTLDQKIQSLNPIPARALQTSVEPDANQGITEGSATANEAQGDGVDSPIVEQASPKPGT